MIAISEHLRNHGYDPTIERHTRIPCIWKKLKTLYNLDQINYNENNLDNAKQGENADIFLEFKLPEEDYDEIQFMRGRRNTSEAPSESASSPLPTSRLQRSPSPTNKKKRKRKEILMKYRASTTGETDDPKLSPAPSLPIKSIKRGRPPGRSSKNKAESSPHPPSVIVDENEATDGLDDDDGDVENILSWKGKGTKSKIEVSMKRKSRRKK